MYAVQKELQSVKEEVSGDMDEDIDLAKVLTVIAVNLSLNKRPRKERGHDEPRDMSWLGEQYHSWNEETFKKRLRLSRETFEFILVEIRGNIVKEATHFKPKPIPPEMRLAICLYRLAHGYTYSTVGDLFGITESTASVIFNEVCK